MPRKSGCLVSWRASYIEDPVERLRFLRTHARPPARSSRRVWICVAGASLLTLLAAAVVAGVRTETPLHRPSTGMTTVRPASSATAAAKQLSPVWQIESGPDSETYSNGLRIDTRFTVAHTPRLYTLFKQDSAVQNTAPVGIVYHSTENHLFPLEPEKTSEILRTTGTLVHYLQERHAYHFMIDRFGRVYKLVRESDAADHAGKSVWWSGTALCLNLNHAFFGVAFEGRTEAALAPAQIDAGRMLTAALRSRYRIPAEDCVTHAQVSVNPSNGLIGWHTDLARNFPFLAVGLPNNYERILPGVSELGFGYDATYLNSAGDDLSAAVRRSGQMRESAAPPGRAAGLERYRLLVQQGR